MGQALRNAYYWAASQYYVLRCDRVAWSVGVSVTLVSPAKTAAPIELPFGLRTWVGPGNHVLHVGPDPTMGRGNFWGRMGVPL